MTLKVLRVIFILLMAAASVEVFENIQASEDVIHTSNDISSDYRRYHIVCDPSASLVDRVDMLVSDTSHIEEE